VTLLVALPLFIYCYPIEGSFCEFLHDFAWPSYWCESTFICGLASFLDDYGGKLL